MPSGDHLLWYKNAVFYGLDVKTFQDTNGDGIGDFKGLIRRLDYLVDLGVTCLWILPFYPSSGCDNGYDITNHFDVDPRFGTLADFRRVVREAKKRGLRVLVDLVMHHTSDQHPYFQAARADAASRYRAYYIWSDRIPEGPQHENIFPGVESGVWHYDEVADTYFHHRFYHFEPDLNVNNPKVQEEIFATVDFWLSFGVSGFRLDAATHLFEDKDLPGTAVDNPGAFMNKLRAFVEARNPDAVLLAESDVAPGAVRTYFGRGRRMHMLFNFLLNNSLFLALARGEAGPLEERLRAQIAPPEKAQWANFVRNLDELDLEQLTEGEREEVFEAFAPREDMRIYGRGIRRRLAPMLDGNLHKLKLAYSLLFALPGSPILMYGEEIGMGEDLSLQERESVRTPMQWSDRPNGGFSEGKPGALVRPVIRSGRFNFRRVNVLRESQDPDSLLCAIKQLIAVRKTCPEIGLGTYEVRKTGSRHVLGILHTWKERQLLALHNLSGSAQTVSLEHGMSECILEDDAYRDAYGAFELNPYGFRWFRYDLERTPEDTR